MGREELHHTLGLMKGQKRSAVADSHNPVYDSYQACTHRKSSRDTATHLFVFSCLSSLPQSNFETEKEKIVSEGFNLT